MVHLQTMLLAWDALDTLQDALLEDKREALEISLLGEGRYIAKLVKFDQKLANACRCDIICIKRVLSFVNNATPPLNLC